MLADKEWSQWSDREIARRCGVSHDFVSRNRIILSFNDSMNTTRKFTHHKTGKPATMNTANTTRKYKLSLGDPPVTTPPASTNSHCHPMTVTTAPAPTKPSTANPPP